MGVEGASSRNSINISSMPIDAQWLSSRFPDLTALTAIGTGGQKTVFSALHSTEGPVVLKIIHPHQDAVTTQREILAVTSVNSPRVPQIYDYGSIDTPTGPYVWIRERHVEGSSLRDVITCSPLRLADSLRLTRQILEAIVSAEQASIIHRDIKPDNIIVDPNGNFWLIDFGIARHLTLTSLTATANFFGKLTLGYAPVEQMRNFKNEIDSRSDLFALGITVIEAHTGIHPFMIPPPANALEVIKRVESDALQVNFGSDDQAVSFAQLISAMTRKRRDLRPRKAEEALCWLDSIEV
jgi:eukaryotic-like serine/threonine-protein kinase